MIADVLLVVHFAIAAFIVGGLPLVWLGAALDWPWVRNPWFRSLHLASILIVAVEAGFQYQCPLTTWENQLREAAGQNIRGESFVGRLLNDILFSESYDPNLIHKIHMAFGGLVLLTFVLAPPRFRRGREAGVGCYQGLSNAPSGGCILAENRFMKG